MRPVVPALALALLLTGCTAAIPEEIAQPSGNEEKVLTTPPASAPQDTVTLSGDGELSTNKVHMAGDYVVSWETFASCYYSADVKGDSSGSEQAFSANDPFVGSNNIYGLPADDYYLKVITGPAPMCGWSVTLTPMP